jgi:hypothetical protein
MPFEDFDKKIRDAADHHHPAYDEKAWKNMEKLLNQHLPQKKDDRRRFFFFLLLFLLVGGGVAVLITQSRKQENPVATADHANSDPGKPVSNPPENIINNQVGPNPETKNETTTIFFSNEEIQKKNSAATSLFYSKPNDEKKVDEKKLQPGARFNNEGAKILGQQIAPVSSEITAVDHVPIFNIEKSNETSQPNAIITDKLTIADRQKNTGIEEPVAKTTATKETKTSKNKKSSSIFFSLSAGPDVSAAELSETGKVKLLAGAGVGYTFKEKFTLRTGFYTGRKVYSASADDYYPPPQFWTYYPNLESVDADCKVYEIPVNLSYHFGSSTKHNWFAGTGISTYLMKTEAYTYHYKDLSGQYASRKWTIRDENNHYFSVLTLSGGYQRHINKTFSIMAEPYVKIPLTGVGYGKVKLNSAGILLSATLKPFGKK